MEGYTPEENEAVEIVQENGLLDRMPAGSLKLMQMMLGAVNEGFLNGDLTKPRPPPPEGYVETLRADWMEFEETMRDRV